VKQGIDSHRGTTNTPNMHACCTALLTCPVRECKGSKSTQAGICAAAQLTMRVRPHMTPPTPKMNPASPASCATSTAEAWGCTAARRCTLALERAGRKARVELGLLQGGQTCKCMSGEGSIGQPVARGGVVA
jgi:hypothetical protein